MKKHIPHIALKAFLLFLVSVFFLACKKYQPSPGTFFVTASSVKVDTTAAQGTNSQNITDLWLYVDGSFQGAYPVGQMMPIQNKNEKVNIQIFAGIKNNGISGTRIPWNLYKKLEFDTLIASQQMITRPCTFVYNPAATFGWIEDFESSAGFSLIESSISDKNESTIRIASPENSFEGKSLEVDLDPNGLLVQIETSKSYTMPLGTGNVYLELDYKGNEIFEVGLIGNNSTLKPALNVNPSETWNKIYIQLATVVNSESVSSSYKIYFKMLHGKSSYSKIFLDNIKLVYI